MKLSVLILTYNSSQFIIDTINSIVNQKTNFEFEIIVSDDASTDKTYDILNDLSKKYYTLRVFQNKTNIGILKNYKNALNKCQGDYIFDLAGDDWVNNDNALQTLADVLDLHPNCSFVSSGYDIYYQKTGKTINFYNKKRIFESLDSYVKNHKIYGTLMAGCCFNKNHLRRYVNFNEYEKNKFEIEDYPIMTDLIMNSSFIRIKTQLYTLRRRRNSASSSNESFLHTKLYFAKKYNFSEEVINEIIESDALNKLYQASLNGNCREGSKYFFMLRRKTIKSLIYYFSSKNKILRCIVNKFRNI